MGTKLGGREGGEGPSSPRIVSVRWTFLYHQSIILRPIQASGGDGLTGTAMDPVRNGNWKWDQPLEAADGGPDSRDDVDFGEVGHGYCDDSWSGV